MRIQRIHLLLIAAIAILIALPTAAGAARMQNCGGGVRASQVACPKAKRIATEYAKTGARSLQGYTCTSGGSKARCVLDRKLVVFPLS
jgi:hypothetical protein